MPPDLPLGLHVLGASFGFSGIIGWLVLYCGIRVIDETALTLGVCSALWIEEQVIALGRAFNYTLRLGSFWIAWELRHDIISLVKLFVHLLLYLLRCVKAFASQAERDTTIEEADQWFTCPPMAVVAAVGSPLVNSFFLLHNGTSGDWEEVWCGAQAGIGELVCRTTNEAGDAWIWTLVRVSDPTSMRAPLVGAGPLFTRTAPFGVDSALVNWICTPPAQGTQWRPTGPELQALVQEAGLLAMRANQPPLPTAAQVTLPGQSAVVALQFGVVPPGPAVAGGAGALALALPGAAGALGPAPAMAGDGFQMDAMAKAISELKALAGGTEKSKKKDKKNSKKKKDKKKKSKKKKHKKSKGVDTSSSSSDSDKSSSSNGSSGSSRSDGLRWGYKAKTKDIQVADLHALEQVKFKQKGALAAYAAAHPGALTANFLAGIFARLSKGRLKKSSQLRQADVVAWVSQYSGLTEVRDVREALTLGEAMNCVNRKEISRAMDIMTQRILAIQTAKLKGGSWEKAMNIELVAASGASLCTPAMLALTSA